MAIPHNCMLEMQVALFMGGLPPVQSCMALLLLATCIWAGHAIALIPGHHHSPPSQHSDCPSIYAGTASATRVSASGPKREGSYLQASKGKATGVDGKGEILEAVLQQSPAAVYERLADMAGARRRCGGTEGPAFCSCLTPLEHTCPCLQIGFVLHVLA
eukprot:1154968-Pelagomonas_calceolata.AAC.11